MAMVSYVPQFKEKTKLQLGRFLNEISMGITREAIKVAPHDKGLLATSIRQKRIGLTHYQVTAGEVGPSRAYARRRELEDNVKFSKPGKKAHYIGDSAKQELRNWQTVAKRYIT